MFGLLGPIALCYWAFRVTGPHPLRRTLVLLAVMLLVLVVMIGPFAIMRRRRLRTLAQRWERVWSLPRASTPDEAASASRALLPSHAVICRTPGREAANHVSREGR